MCKKKIQTEYKKIKTTNDDTLQILETKEMESKFWKSWYRRLPNVH